MNEHDEDFVDYRQNLNCCEYLKDLEKRISQCEILLREILKQMNKNNE